MPETKEDRLLEKMEILVRLQALNLITRYDSQKEKILFLRKAGFQLKDIADLLDTSPNVVNVTLVKARQQTKKKVASEKVENLETKPEGGDDR